MRKAVLLLVVTILFSAAAAQAEFYQWTDREGREFYTNEKDKIPAEYRGAAKPVEVREERVTVGPPPAASDPRPVKPQPHKDRNNRGEDYWRKRAGDLRKEIREQENARDRLIQQEREEERSGKLTAAKRKKARAAREKKQEKIAGNIARLTHELEVELPDEARKAEALPGWLR